MSEQVVLPGTEEKSEKRPDDLIDYEEAGRLVDRSKTAVRWWVREGQLKSWPAEEGNRNSKRLVSKSELLTMVVQTGKSINPGGPGRGEPPPPTTPPAEVALLVKTAELDGARAELQALRVALEAEQSRSNALAERAEVERMRAAEWKDRAEGLSAEVAALRVMSGLPWWRRLLG